MFNKFLSGLALASATLMVACQTTEPQPTNLTCRAPIGEEFEIFRAVVARDTSTLTRLSADGPARSALMRNDPYVAGHLWGSQGYTSTAVVGVLTQPPPCVIQLPPRLDAEGNTITTQRTIAVYQQSRFQTLSGGSVTATPGQITNLPGVRGGDYFRCEFVQTAAGWRLTDLCGLPTTRTVS